MAKTSVRERNAKLKENVLSSLSNLIDGVTLTQRTGKCELSFTTTASDGIDDVITLKLSIVKRDSRDADTILSDMHTAYMASSTTTEVAKLEKAGVEVEM